MAQEGSYEKAVNCGIGRNGARGCSALYTGFVGVRVWGGGGWWWVVKPG